MAVTGGSPEVYKDGGLRLSCVAAAAILADQLVVLTGNTVNGLPEVNVAGAGATQAHGVAVQNASAALDVFTVAFPISMVYLCKASGAINAGDFVKTGAAGTVVAIAADGDPRLIVGFALEDIADTVKGRIGLL